MLQFEALLSTISSLAWKFFLPVLIVLTVYTTIRLFTTVLKQTTKDENYNLVQVLGPTAISLGSMIGTGAVIGVLAAINRLPDGVAIEAIAIWSLIGLIITLPLIYAEVITSKIMGMVPSKYIGSILGNSMSKLYIISFFLLYIFGFDGLQYSGIASAANVLSTSVINTTLSSTQEFIFVVIPVFIIVAIILLTKKHTVFMRSVGTLIFTAVIAYVLLLIAYIGSTGDYITIYGANLISELINRSAMIVGLPIGLLLGLQRIIQTSELGIGSIAMAASEADTKPRFAASAALMPVVITVIIAILGTSYITSYASYANNLSVGSITLFDLATSIETQLGSIGLYTFLIFMLLSGLTTLIGSYYYAETVLHKSQNFSIGIYLLVTFVAGTLAIFGFSVVFDLIDLLMFVVVGINLLAITKFMTTDYKRYSISNK